MVDRYEGYAILFRKKNDPGIDTPTVAFGTFAGLVLCIGRCRFVPCSFYYGRHYLYSYRVHFAQIGWKKRKKRWGVSVQFPYVMDE